MALDRPGVRPALPGEGYLSFHILGGPARIFPAGEERTGWTDIRAPWYTNAGIADLTTDTRLGFDRSDRTIKVNNTIITHTNNPPADGNGVAIADVPRDFNFANQIYQQIGISVVVEATRGANAAVPNLLGAPPAPNAAGVSDSDRVLAVSRSANATTVNNAYVVNYANGTFGFTIGPEDTIAPNTRPNSGVVITQSARNDTFAHELGHFVIDQYRFAGADVHSPNANDLMASGGLPRNIPNNNVKAPIPLAFLNGAPSNPGEPNGTLGGVDRFIANMNLPGDPAPPVGGYSQPTAIYNAEKDGRNYVQVSPDLSNAPVYADRADFDWVEDSFRLEDIAGRADNHPGARDALYFQPGVNVPPTHNDPINGNHDHDAWGELVLGGFTSTNFRIADVVSAIARYSDMDVGDDGRWSPRESALDYFVEFSADGNNWTIGTPTDVYTEGWTISSDAENFVARWLSPFDARFLRVTALGVGFFGHDGSTQIDAVIVSAVPEPAGLASLLLTVPLLARRRRCAAGR